MLYLDNGIPVNSATFANKETWFELIGAEMLVEHSHTVGGFSEAAGSELLGLLPLLLCFVQQNEDF